MSSISAPAEVIYCSHCAARLHTEVVAGKPRRRCAQCGHIHFVEPKVGVGALILTDQRLLLVKRAMPPERGKWSLPAGYLDIGETPESVAIRETREETGLEIDIEQLVGVFSNPPEQGGASLFILYQGRAVGGTLAAADDAADAAYFAADELPELAFASTRAAVQWLLASPKQ